MKESNNETANRLRSALLESGLSQQELANKSGVSKSSISQYINGTHVPGNIKAGLLAEVLKCDPLWLMGFDVPMKRTSFDIETSLEKLTSDEKRLIHFYRLLNQDGKDKTIEYVGDLVGNLKYKKDSSGSEITNIA